MESEILSDEELAMITGYQARAWQRRWLNSHGWHYIESRGRRPLVGRQYARQQLGSPSAEPSPSAPAKQAWTPDFSKVS
jgi:hypothetical protein